jgi:enoyl-CoA hydratase/carnithine racemase
LGRALELVLTADMIPAAEALRLGLVNRVVDDGVVVAETMALAARIAAKAPLAVALAKQAVRAAYGATLGECLERERSNQLRLFKTPEALEHMRAFLSARRSGSGRRRAEDGPP